MLNQKIALVLLGIILIAGCTAQPPQTTTTTAAATTSTAPPEPSSSEAATKTTVDMESETTASTVRGAGTAVPVSMNALAIVKITKAS